MKKVALFVLFASFLGVFSMNLSAQDEAEDTGAVSTVNQSLLRLEKEIRDLRSDQEKIDAKNAEIKKELANLRIWIHRR